MDKKQYYWATAITDEGKTFKCVVCELNDLQYMGYILPEWYPELFVDDREGKLFANFLCKRSWVTLGEPLSYFNVTSDFKPVYAGSELSDGRVNEVVAYSHFMEIDIDGDRRSTTLLEPRRS